MAAGRAGAGRRSCLLSWLMTGKSAAPAGRRLIDGWQATKPGASTPVQPADLDVRLEDLKQARPRTATSNRNPFRFYVTPPPPPPPVAAGGQRRWRRRHTERRRPRASAAAADSVEVHRAPGRRAGKGKIAAFSDCRTTMRGREGEIIGGQYRLVQIGLESVVLEYADGRGARPRSACPARNASASRSPDRIGPFFMECRC